MRGCELRGEAAWVRGGDSARPDLGLSPLRHRKEGNDACCFSVDGPRDLPRDAKQVGERQAACAVTSMWTLKKHDAKLQDKKHHRHRKQMRGYQTGGRDKSGVHCSVDNW